MVKELNIKLLGTFHASHSQETISGLEPDRIQQLLTYLLLHREAPQSRQQVSFLFWPEHSEKQAFANLRQLLFRLRKTLPGEYILADEKTIQWNPESNYTLDVVEFEHSINLPTTDKKQREVDEDYEYLLTKAVNLYRGRLLENCYEDWIIPHREKLHQQYIWALQELVHRLENNRNYTLAIRFAHKMLEDDPFDESFYQTIMRLQVLSGNRIKAVRTYRSCEEFLQRELGVTPSTQTKALFQRLQNISDTEHDLADPVPEHTQKKEVKLVGRSTEWVILLKTWKKTLAGNAHVVLLTGEAGIGKTRLATELFDYVTKQGYRADYAKSYEAGEPLSYGPVISWLRSNKARAELKKLDTTWLTELVRLLPELQEEYPELARPDPLKESWQRNCLFEAISKGLAVNEHPRLLFLDDLQWCDSETLAWLNFLFHSSSAKKVSVVGMMRPVEADSNTALQQYLVNVERESRLERIYLNPLNKEQSIELASLEANRTLEPVLGQHIFEESEGNPLFILETVREGHLLEHPEQMLKQKINPLDPTSVHMPRIPNKINEIITVRLQKLSKEARDLLGLAATIGREFNFEIISCIHEEEESAVMKILDELMEHSIIQELQAGVFDFTHDKLREVVYRNLNRTKKQWLHQQIARAIKSSGNEKLKGVQAILAFHFAKAGEIEKAINHYVLAAGEESEILSKQDTVYFRAALGLLEQLEDQELREEWEYEIFHKLAVSLVHNKGNSPDEIARINIRIRSLAEKLNRAPTAPELFAQAMEDLLKGNLKNFETTAIEMYELSEKTGDTIATVEACYMLGGSELYFKGNAADSYPYFRQGLELYDPGQHQIYMQKYDLDAGIILQAGFASYLWMTCQTREACKMVKKAHSTALSSDKLFNIVYVHFMLAWWNMLLYKPRQTHASVKQFKTFDVNYELFHWNIHSKVMLGWSMAHQHKLREGTKLMREAIDELKKYPFIPDLPYYYCVLAELLGKQGNVKEALAFTDRALKFIDQTGIRFAEAEIYRIQGELLLLERTDDIERATSSFQKASCIARQQGLAIFEYRANLCLDRINNR